MKFSQILKALRGDNGRDDPAKIRAEIDREREAFSTIDGRRRNLSAQRRQAVLDADLDGQERLDAELGRLARLEETALERLPLLEQRLQAALAEQREEDIAAHQAAMLAQFRRLAGALAAAAAENQTAIALFDDACSRFGAHEAEKRFRRMHYAGLLFQDLTAAWIADMERNLAPAKPKAQVAPAEQKAAPTRRRPGQITDSQKPVSLPGMSGPPDPLPPTVPQRASHTVIGPPPDGHRIVEIIRGGYETPEGLQCSRGDRVILTEQVALEAARRGAIEIVESPSKMEAAQ